jgi:mono/diheme cytochrome c family protein
MRPYRSLFAVMILAGLCPSLAAAADAQHGKELAQRWCAECHLVASDQRQASADVAPFASIARRGDFNAAQLAFFLLDPHPKMPNMSLSRAEAGDLAAYIASLK